MCKALMLCCPQGDNTRDWIEIGKGMPVTRMVAANQVPHVIDTISAERPKEQPTLTEAE